MADGVLDDVGPFYWQLPLQPLTTGGRTVSAGRLCAGEEEGGWGGLGSGGSGLGEPCDATDHQLRGNSVTGCAGPWFWRLPLPALAEEDLEIRQVEVGELLLASPHPPQTPPSLASRPPQAQPAQLHVAAEQPLAASGEAALSFHALDVWDSCSAAASPAGAPSDLSPVHSASFAGAADAEEHLSRVSVAGMPLPQQLAFQTLWHLDVASLARGACACQDWARIARSKARWRARCQMDWGMRSGGSRREYRNQVKRWQILESTLASLRGRGHPGNAFGSSLRLRLFKALEVLVELGAAEEGPAAGYPARVANMLHVTGANETLLALLDDESPHLVCLAIRCLADQLVEEEPGSATAASALHATAVVASAAVPPPPDGAGGGGGTRLPRDEATGPWARAAALRAAVAERGALNCELLEGEDFDLVEAAARLMLNFHGNMPGAPFRVCCRGPAGLLLGPHTVGQPRQAPTPEALVAAWVGVWTGEMRYARGGARHGALRLVLGIALGAEAQASDPPAVRLAGSGLDEQSGPFVVEAVLPGPGAGAAAAFAWRSVSGVSLTQASAVALRLFLHYKDRRIPCELISFVSAGRTLPDGERTRVLYGVWGMMPSQSSQKKHLFLLQRSNDALHEEATTVGALPQR